MEQAVSLGAKSWAAGGSPSGAGAQCSEDLVGGSTRQLWKGLGRRTAHQGVETQTLARNFEAELYFLSG